jgi:hypothetical protein
MYIFDTLYADHVVYSAQNIGDALSAAIWSGLGVEAVDYDYKADID